MSTKKLPVLVGPLLAIQSFSHPLTFNFPWSLGYTRKLEFESPWGNYFTQPTYDAQKYQTCTDTTLSWYQFTPWSSRASEIHFLCPKNFTSGQCRIRTTSRSAVERALFNARIIFSYGLLIDIFLVFCARGEKSFDHCILI